MARKYKIHTPTLKLKVTLEAVHNQKTVNQIASEYGVAPVQVTEWKKQLLEKGVQLFQNKRRSKAPGPGKGYSPFANPFMMPEDR